MKPEAHPDDCPFDASEIKAMQDNLPLISDTTKGLFYLATAGTMQLEDCVFTTWRKYDLEKRGLLRGWMRTIRRSIRAVIRWLKTRMPSTR